MKLNYTDIKIIKYLAIRDQEISNSVQIYIFTPQERRKKGREGERKKKRKKREGWRDGRRKKE